MVILVAIAALWLLATAGWGVSVVRGSANVVDVLWGVSQVVLAATCLAVGETTTARSWLAAGLVAVWGVRLSVHLALRDRGRGEDWRHRRARQQQRWFAWRSLPGVFWFQLVGGGLVVGLPLFAVVSSPQPELGWVDAVGVLLWTGGFVTEVAADAQLQRFRRQPGNRGRVLEQGLWRYSRHPNYFGEVVVWTGIALVGLAADAWWALASPVMVLIVILRISGVRVMDEHLRATRGDRYDRYAAMTSAFVPLPKRSATGGRDRTGLGYRWGGGLRSGS